jgi:hypothetical protein
MVSLFLNVCKCSLTLSLLMSYIYGDPSKARNFNVVYIYRPMFGNAESRLFVFAAQYSKLYTAEWFPVSQLCVNTLPATKVALISHECISVISLESVLHSSSFGKADNSLFLSDCTMSEHRTYHKSIFVVIT